METIYETEPDIDFWTHGEIKGWKSVRRVHFIHSWLCQYQVYRFFGISFKRLLKKQRVVRVDVYFHNGMYYSQNGSYGDNAVKSSIRAASLALQNFAREARIAA